MKKYQQNKQGSKVATSTRKQQWEANKSYLHQL
jgi:hypothetical protein